MTPALLAMAFLSPADGSPTASMKAARVFDFASLTNEEAGRLEGKRAVFRVRVFAVGSTEGGRVSLLCTGPAGLAVLSVPIAEPHRWRIGDLLSMTIEATLRTVDGGNPPATRHLLFDDPHPR